MKRFCVLSMQVVDLFGHHHLFDLLTITVSKSVCLAHKAALSYTQPVVRPSKIPTHWQTNLSIGCGKKFELSAHVPGYEAVIKLCANIGSTSRKVANAVDVDEYRTTGSMRLLQDCVFLVIEPQRQEQSSKPSKHHAFPRQEEQQHASNGTTTARYCECHDRRGRLLVWSCPTSTGLRR